MKLDSVGAPIPEGATCAATGKRMWSSRKDAKRAARRLYPGAHLSAYACDECGWVHLGRIPSAVVAGQLDRVNIVPKGRP